MRTEISFPLSSRALAVRVSLLYIVGSALWVVFSDAILHRFIWDAPCVVWSLETAKGLVYVAVSGLLLGVFIYHCHRDQERSRLVTESKLRKLRESGIIGIFCYDANGTITQANDAFLRMVGYSREELRQGQISLHGMTSPEFADLNAAMDRALLERGFSPLYEEELIRKDGSRVSVLGSRAISGDDDAHGIAYTLDISQLKTAEAEREHFRTQLIKSEKLNALGQLAGGVAHDFSNLLAVIIGSAYLVKENLDPSTPAYEHISRSIRAANQAAALARKLLAFGTKQEFRPEVFDLNKLVREHCEMLQNLIGKNITVQVLPSTDSWVVADPAHIEQILMNLLLNARDAMASHGRITIKTEPHSRFEGNFPIERQYVALVVSDTGSGMPPEILQHIFEPFFTTKGKESGTGLGLSTVYGIVKQNDGDISVESGHGRGTTFTVLLPRAESPTRLWSEATALAASKASGRPPTILLLEDSTDLRLTLARILEGAGYQVLQAGSSAEAIDVAKQYQGTIELLLSDVMMPGISGPDAAVQILGLRPGIKVVFLTGYADQAPPLQGAMLIEKPVEPKTLLAAVGRVLGYERAA